MHWGSPCHAYCVVFLPLPIDAFHLKLNRFKFSLIVETVIVPCVFNLRPLIVVFMYERGFFLGNAHCVLIDPSQLRLCQRNTTSSNSQMTASKPVSFVQELNKGITGTNPFSKLILVYEPVIFFLCFVRLDWGLVVA